MNVCGIITEYNPFHNGHLYHIQKARELTQCDILIAVMSGNFVQRGEPAIINKWERAKCAIEHGVDLVLELPFPFVVQSADHFASGAVTTLQLAGVDAIVFGSETNDLTSLKAIADKPFLESDKQQKISNAKSFEASHKELSSNDILGICYLRALQNTSIRPYTIQRTNAYLGEDLNHTISSATAIRKGILNQQDVSHTTVMADQLTTMHTLEKYYPYLQTLLRTLPTSYLSQLFLMDEGIEHLLMKNAGLCTTLDDFLQMSTSTRYTKSRIQRTLIHVLNQTLKSEMNTLPPLSHIRVLAFNTIGKQYLAKLREKDDLLIASRFNQIPTPYRLMEYKACEVYAIPALQKDRKEIIKSELQSPLYVR